MNDRPFSQSPRKQGESHQPILASHNNFAQVRRLSLPEEDSQSDEYTHVNVKEERTLWWFPNLSLCLKQSCGALWFHYKVLPVTAGWRCHSSGLPTETKSPYYETSYSAVGSKIHKRLTAARFVLFHPIKKRSFNSFSTTAYFPPW